MYFVIANKPINAINAINAINDIFLFGLSGDSIDMTLGIDCNAIDIAVICQRLHCNCLLITSLIIANNVIIIAIFVYNLHKIAIIFTET